MPPEQNLIIYIARSQCRAGLGSAHFTFCVQMLKEVAMNVSFFMLLLVLFALAFLTGWNKHVLALFGISGFLWATMVW